MPFTELVIPQLNTSPESIKVFNETWPTLARQALATRPNIDSQYQGWVLSEDSKDVQSEHKYLVLLGAKFCHSSDYNLGTRLNIGSRMARQGRLRSLSPFPRIQNNGRGEQAFHGRARDTSIIRNQCQPR